MAESTGVREVPRSRALPRPRASSKSWVAAGTGSATRLTVDLFADDVRVAGVARAVSWVTASIAQRRERVLPLCVSGASAVTSAVAIWLLASQAARYSDRNARSETDGSTSIDRLPLLGAPPATSPPNHFDSTNVTCCTSPARLVPDATVLRRASSSLRSESFFEDSGTLVFERREQL
jgi:hypothetical protein